VQQNAPPGVPPSTNADMGSMYASSSDPPQSLEPSMASGIRRVVLTVREKVRTMPNIFGLTREFYDRPSHDPEADVTLEDLAGLTVASVPSNPATAAVAPLLGSQGMSVNGASAPLFSPFPNISQYLLSNWYIENPSGQRSAPDLNNLIQNVLLDARFDPRALASFTANKMNQLFDGIDANADGLELTGEGWKQNVSVQIQIPEGKAHWTSPQGRAFNIPGLHHRSITGIIKAVFSSMSNLHFTPFASYWKPPGTPVGSREHRVYGDVYSSSAFYKAHEEVQLPKYKVPGCNLERVVVACMFWSDSTHLTSFGTAKLWPIYMFFGNHSKWWWGKPSAHLCNHLAYIPSVSF
jgi:hypothetical protein